MHAHITTQNHILRSCALYSFAPLCAARTAQTSVIESALALNQIPDSDDTVNLLAAWTPNKTATVSRTLQPGAGGLGLAPGRHKITFRSDSIIKSRTQVFRVSTGGMNAVTLNRAFPAGNDGPSGLCGLFCGEVLAGCCPLCSVGGPSPIAQFALIFGPACLSPTVTNVPPGVAANVLLLSFKYEN